MPGSSLWLLPPANHRLEPILSSLIKRTASHFKSPHLFLPHVTLTSEISSSTYGSDPQKWLDTISFPAGKEVLVKLGRLESQDVFVKKLYSKVSKDGVLDIGRVSRKCVEGFAEDGKAKEWTENEYYPHLSLLYHDCLKVSEEEIGKIESLAKGAGISLDGEGELGGWVGGRVVLVATDKPIKEWTPIAERQL